MLMLETGLEKQYKKYVLKIEIEEAICLKEACESLYREYKAYFDATFHKFHQHAFNSDEVKIYQDFMNYLTDYHIENRVEDTLYRINLLLQQLDQIIVNLKLDYVDR